MKKLLFGLMIASLLVFGERAFALTLTLSGAEITVEYTEPTTNENGAVLEDLSHTSIYYDMGDGAVKAVDVPAANPTGGGVISQAVTVPVTSGMERDVQIWATASDGSGNESAPSETKVVRVDRLAPSAPN